MLKWAEENANCPSCQGQVLGLSARTNKGEIHITVKCTKCNKLFEIGHIYKSYLKYEEERLSWVTDQD